MIPIDNEVRGKKDRRLVMYQSNSSIRGVRFTILAAALLVGLIAMSTVWSQTPDNTGKDKAEILAEYEQFNDVISTDEAAKQRNEYNANTEGAKRRYDEWLAAFLSSGTNPRTLEWKALPIQSLPGPESVVEAVSAANLVISGTVLKVDFQPGPMTIGDAFITLRIDSVVKGDFLIGQEVTVLFGGGPHPYPSENPTTAVMAYFAPAPILFEGERAVLILDKSPRYENVYSPQVYAGVNKIEEDRVVPVQGSLLEEAFSGKSEIELLGILDQAAKE